jgi:hypothetical protein
MSRRATGSIFKWWDAPSANSKGTSTHEIQATVWSFQIESCPPAAKPSTFNLLLSTPQKMSLINDALKRARQSQQVNIPGGPPLRPVEPSSGGGMGWILLAVIILLLVAASFFIGMALSKRKPETVATAPEISQTQQVASVTAAAISGVPISAPAPASNAPSSVSINNQTAAISNSIPQPPPPPPQPKLQGIIFTPPKPWAIVNGKTVYVGDSVGDFTVKEISRNAVTLENADGSEKKLLIGQ